jgi:hypothetical protein
MRKILGLSGGRISLFLALTEYVMLNGSITSESLETARIKLCVQNTALFTGIEAPDFRRHQMLTFLNAQGLSDAKIQPISGHGSRKSPDIYQHLSIEAVENDYQKAVRNLDV